MQIFIHPIFLRCQKRRSPRDATGPRRPRLAAVRQDVAAAAVARRPAERAAPPTGPLRTDGGRRTAFSRREQDPQDADGAGHERGALSVQPADCLLGVHATQRRLWQRRWVGGHGGVTTGSRWG